MRHAAYNALFRDLAARHARIRHQSDSPRFARVVVSIDPMQRLVDLSEMQEMLLGRDLQPGAGEQVLVLESYQSSYANNLSDNRTTRRRGAFFVLEQVPPKDQDAISAALEEAEITAEQLIAGAMHALREDFKTRFDENSFACDAIGPLGDGTWYGVRLDFEWTGPANAGLTYNPLAFPS